MNSLGITLIIGAAVAVSAKGQLVDETTAASVSADGIRKSYVEQIGRGRGDAFTPESSAFLIQRDPFRAIRRGRELFQRKFTKGQGLGPNVGDGAGDINKTLAIGAGLADSCALCHGRPRGSAGTGGNVVTRPDSRDAPHLFGLGIKEMLGDEITAELRARRQNALAQAKASGQAVVTAMTSKGIDYGSILVKPDGTVDTSALRGVDADLRVRPLFAQGGEFSIRAFIVGALQNEMGMQAVDPDMMTASRGGRVLTPAGMMLDGSADHIDPPPTDDASADPDGDGVKNEVPEAVVDYLEFYLLNYFKPGTYEQSDATRRGQATMDRMGCTSCHVQSLRIDRDRRVADVETVYDAANGSFNGLYATATGLFQTVNDGSGYPALKQPGRQPFVAQNIYSDFKRHDVGAEFYERNYDGTVQREFMTTALWGAGTSSPYGHDGRSVTLSAVILRHGGEAQAARDAYAALSSEERRNVVDFLNSLILFPPDDTASNLGPTDRTTFDYPQWGHGSIRLATMFNDPKDPE